MDGYIYRLDTGGVQLGEIYLFDAEAHNPRTNPEFFKDDPRMQEFLQMASHGQVMLSMFRENFPSLPDGTVLLLDEPEMALSVSNQRRILKMLLELADQQEISRHLRHAFAGADRGQRDLHDQPGRAHQQERAGDGFGHTGRQHYSIGLFLHAARESGRSASRTARRAFGPMPGISSSSRMLAGLPVAIACSALSVRMRKAGTSRLRASFSRHSRSARFDRGIHGSRFLLLAYTGFAGLLAPFARRLDLELHVEGG